MNASGGSEMVMNRAYINAERGQAICCWDAPDQKAIEGLFEKAGVKTKAISEVVEYIP